MATVKIPLSRMHYEGHDVQEILAQVKAIEAAGHTVHLELSGPHHMYMLLNRTIPPVKENVPVSQRTISTTMQSMLAAKRIVPVMRRKHPVSGLSMIWLALIGSIMVSAVLAVTLMGM